MGRVAIAPEKRTAEGTIAAIGTKSYLKPERAAMFIRIGYEIVIESKDDAAAL